MPTLSSPYALDVKKSKVDFFIQHLKLSEVHGKFDKFSAVIDYDLKTNRLNVLEGIVDVSSVDTANQKRDDHLRAEDIFHVEQYPNMTFKMTSVTNDKIFGDLMIKGITKPVAFDSVIKSRGNALEITATTKIKRSDFGVVWESSLKDSLVNDDLQIKLTIIANPK
ncbi:MAG: YceI family protein [Helicobacter sp.]|nr:YceI family protein [Helicobacter sp.]